MRFKDEVLRALARWGKGEPALPVRLILYLTARCNLSCPFCEVPEDWRKGQQSEPELSLKQWLSIVHEALGLGVLDWWFPGQGEPFYDPQKALSIVREIKMRSPRAYCHFTTNGTLLSRRICEQLVSLGVDDLNVSIDGPDAETNDLMRGQGAFVKSVGAMKTITLLKRELNRPTPELVLTTVLSARNYHRIPSMVELAKEVGASKVTVNPLRVSGGNEAGLKKYSLQIPDSLDGPVRQALRDAKVHADRAGIRLHLNGWEEIEMGVGSRKPVEGFRPENPRGFMDAACFEPFYSMGIGPSGKATFCASASDVGTPDADVLRFGLEEVWYGRFMMVARERLLNHQPVINCCGCGIKSLRKNLKEEMAREG